MKKVYVVGPEKRYSKWISDHVLTDNLDEADIVIFTGGEDVTPSLYGCEKHHTTWSNLDRDLKEKEIFEKIRPDQFCIGICRGSQLLCCLNGGLLIQDVTNHAIRHTHEIYKANGRGVYEITSTHHQMQYPFNLNEEDYKVLYYADFRSGYYAGDKIPRTIPCEPEIVLYQKEGKPKCLAIQGHPEMMRLESPTIAMLNNLINSLC